MKLYTNKKPCKCRGCNKTLPVGSECVYTQGRREAHFICKTCVIEAFKLLCY